MRIAIATALGVMTGNPFIVTDRSNVVFAASNQMLINDFDQDFVGVSQGYSEQMKTNFAYEMAQITEEIVAAPNTDVATFKKEFAYAIARVTAKMMPFVSDGRQADFSYKMAQITSGMLRDPQLDVEKAKADFTYAIAQLTAKIIASAENTSKQAQIIATAANTPNSVGNLSSGGKVTQEGTKSSYTGGTGQKDIDVQTYQSLVQEAEHAGEQKDQSDHKVELDGEVRSHFALNRGSEYWNRNSAGLRVRLGMGMNLDGNWRLNGMVEGEKSLNHYNNSLDLARFNAAGKIGHATTATVGSFGYTMAEGNIYDSEFKGVKFDLAEPIRYSFAYGETDSSQETFVATAKYTDFDYDLEAGIYHYQPNAAQKEENTIHTVAGNYHFGDFSLGAMALGATQKRRTGKSSRLCIQL